MFSNSYLENVAEIAVCILKMKNVRGTLQKRSRNGLQGNSKQWVEKKKVKRESNRN